MSLPARARRPDSPPLSRSTPVGGNPIRNQSLADRHERRSRHLEEELARKTAENDMLKRVAARGGGEGEKETEGTKRRNEELKQKCETTEKEVATLKKHIDNLVSVRCRTIRQSSAKLFY